MKADRMSVAEVSVAETISSFVRMTFLDSTNQRGDLNSWSAGLRIAPKELQIERDRNSSRAAVIHSQTPNGGDASSWDDIARTPHDHSAVVLASLPTIGSAARHAGR